MKQARVLGKIKKCLALAESDNPNEAATALRQAQKLMQLHNIDATLLKVAMVGCAYQSATRPPAWHQMLLNVIDYAFGTSAMYWQSHRSRIVFIGLESQVKMALYAYEVLYRQLLRQRALHVKKQTRCKRATKTRRGNLYAEAWLIAAAAKLEKFSLNKEHQQLIDDYKSHQFGNLGQLKSKKKEVDKACNAGDARSINSGYKDGKKASIDKPIKNSYPVCHRINGA